MQANRGFTPDPTTIATALGDRLDRDWAVGTICHNDEIYARRNMTKAVPRDLLRHDSPAPCDTMRRDRTARVREIELRRVRLPLVHPFRTALGIDRERDALVVRVATDSGEGWGECVAPREPFYAPEWVGGAQAVIREFLGPLAARANRLGRRRRGARWRA